MKFEYFAGPQRSPEWFKIRLGKVTASRLEDWLSVSRAKGKEGTPLKARLDYEKELMFERQFGVSFQTFVTDAMQDGIDYEGFAAAQYALMHPEYTVEECGCWYNDAFVASPDRVVLEQQATEAQSGEAKPRDPFVMVGLLEIKIVKDNTFTEILMSGVPPKHMKQIQGQLYASGLPWCDYVALNFNTKSFVVIHVEADQEFHEYLELALTEQLVTQPFEVTNVHEVRGEIPQGVVLGAHIDRSDSNIGGMSW